MENFSIRAWAEDDRPREKLMLKGRNALSNAELLAILIGSGTKNKSAVELSQDILNSCKNNLRELSKINLNELTQFSGIGEAKAITIIGAMELARRRDTEAIEEKTIIKRSEDAYRVFRSSLEDLYQEEFYALFLNQRNQVIQLKQLSIGGMNSTLVDVRILFRMALELKATSIIVAHNHPSGNLNPSEADKALTKKIVESGKIMDINLLDHLILADDKFYSFADAGLL
jgi:DNA repair protein RadC